MIMSVSFQYENLLKKEGEDPQHLRRLFWANFSIGNFTTEEGVDFIRYNPNIYRTNDIFDFDDSILDVTVTKKYINEIRLSDGDIILDTYYLDMSGDYDFDDVFDESEPVDDLKRINYILSGRKPFNPIEFLLDGFGGSTLVKIGEKFGWEKILDLI